jgi:branched-chain amino acid transport system substrate-binding protein
MTRKMVRQVAFLVGLSAAFLSSLAKAEKKYDPGASDTEIKIGNIVPYSGPASAYGMIGKVEAAYFKMINDQGGINGRKITSSAMTMPTVRRRRSSRHAGWSRATKSY